MPTFVTAQTSGARYQRIPDFCRTYGMSRSGAYRKINEGCIRAVKLDSATLIDCESADAYFATLPTVGGPKPPIMPPQHVAA